MLSRFGLFIYDRRKLTVVVSTLLMVFAVVAMVAVGGNLSSEGFIDESSESERVGQQLADEFGRGDASLIVLFDADRPVDDGVRAEVEAALAPLADDPGVVQVLTTWNTGNPAMISADGDSVYAVVLLNETGEEQLTALVDSVQSETLDISMTGDGTIGEAISHEVEQSLVRAETIAIPLTIIMLVIIFGSVIAAGLPVLVGVLSIVSAVAGVMVVSQVTDQSVFAINIISLLGLGLGIDYSLFMVARFREEIAKRPIRDALSVTMGTTGKAILFSGVTVIFGLAATQFFPLMAVRSMGQAGMLVVGLALLYGLTVLPALLALLGQRVNSIPVGIPRRFRRERPARQSGSFWAALARSVMRQPVRYLVPVVAILVLAGIPFLRLNLTAGDVRILPEGSEPRVVSERLSAEFPAGEDQAIPVVVTADDGNALSPASIAALQEFLVGASEIEGVVGSESIVSSGTTSLDWSGYDGTPATIPAEVHPSIERTVRGDAVFVQILTSEVGDTTVARDIVRDLRDIDVTGAEAQIGGFTASSVDTIDAIRSATPIAVLFVLIGSYIILLLVFGSVLLPLKAIVMTLLSISASLGTLVLVFQDGRFADLLGFTATGNVISTTPILMFCILFGLSMDYEVLMLTRIQEEYLLSGDNTAAVALGLERTAGVITGAAAVMMVVFGAFMTASIVIIQSLGFGLALAVLIDATIVRGLLVPATMRLMGRWNWWAPTPVKSIVDRFGFSHVDARVPASGD